jgi:radical SAM superfamily enzyme YgiQ (UPF0313 family)
MRAFASSLHSWAEIERNESTSGRHGLTFPLAVLAALGRTHGLEIVAEEDTGDPSGFDAIFISIMDPRIALNIGRHFREWKIPMLRSERTAAHPLVWMGGQGLRNPMPFAPIADLIVLGDAEPCLPSLLDLWERHGRTGFLSAASTVEGVYVPALHRRGEARLRMAIAEDIGITLREDVRVTLNGSRRIELARGCRYKCAMCSLGWRQPYRENGTADVIAAIKQGPRQIHLQAGDAESHSGIGQIRAAMVEHGARDSGWTGRLDTVNTGDEIAGGKRYAFGVEGVSHRLRRLVGKGWLTDERLVSSTVDVLKATEQTSTGRAAWHMIAGLPTARLDETLDLLRVLQAIDNELRGTVHRNLAIHWQPFQPIPGTPLQWCAAGSGARKMAGLLRGAESMTWLHVRQQTGRTDEMARLCTVLSRADERGSGLLARMADRNVSADEAAELCGVGWGALPVDASLPWDWIEGWMSKDALARCHKAALARA